MSNTDETVILGCLLDVSKSMRETLEAGRRDERAGDRLRAVLNAALQIARAERKRHGNALIFVGIFGLDEKARCPPVVDLCSVVNAFLVTLRARESGHDLLIELANNHERAFIAKYIRTKLTDNEAKVLHGYLRRNPQKIPEFIDGIPTDEENRTTRRRAKITTYVSSSMLGVAFGPAGLAAAAAVSALSGPVVDHVADEVENSAADRSKAVRMAQEVWDEWWGEAVTFELRHADEVITLLERIQDDWQVDSNDGSEVGGSNKVLDGLRRYVYGRTPLKRALHAALETFPQPGVTEHATFARTLLVISDGFSTDGDVRVFRDMLLEKKVNLAAVYLTNSTEGDQRRLYDDASESWNQGQRMLFNVATRIPSVEHPIPVLNSMGWDVPLSGQVALYAVVCSVAMLEEFCELLLTARFGSADVLLDIAGRARLNQYVDKEHKCSCENPEDQGRSPTCYAHATAAVLHMALCRVKLQRGDPPSIDDIRARILNAFPARSGGWSSRKVLKMATEQNWYYPIRHYHKIDNERDARRAIAKRHPLLMTFHLSKSGWAKFRQHFREEDTKRLTLTQTDMAPYQSGPSAGGHAVVLTGCSPSSLTFLNSWGTQRGDKGQFSIEDSSVLQCDGHKVLFYDVEWKLEDLCQEDKDAFNRFADDGVRKRAEQHPSVFELEVLCPLCKESAPIANFTGSLRQAVCPGCKGSFKPEPGYLAQALYVRAGL